MAYYGKKSVTLYTNVPVAPYPIEIETEEEMAAVLTAANVGRVYRYVGTTTANYTNGDLYEVEAS